MKKRSFAVMLLVLCMLATLMPATALAADNGFADVAADAWYAEPVAWAVENEITGGIGNNLFAPDRVTTRAEAVTFLYKALGSPAAEAAENPFQDVSADDWFYAPVMWAIVNGVTNGTAPDKFSPDMTCTRAQSVTFLWKVFG